MSGAKKCVPQLRGVRQTRDSQTQARASAPARATHAAQLKPPARTTPAARPATNAPVQPKRPPSAPPVYRPQPTPKVLQKKTPPGHPNENTRASASRPAQTPSRPAAPPVYRPEPKKVVQPKAVPGAHARPPRSATPQVKPASAPAVRRPAVPAAATPQRSATPPVIQRMKRKKEWDDTDDIEAYEEKRKKWKELDDRRYNYLKQRHGKNKRPPVDPRKRAPSPEFTYHYEVSQFFSDKGLFDLADRYMDYTQEVGGKSVGQTVGTREEDEYDESYLDVPSDVRPSAPAALWKKVYAGLRDSTKYTKLQWVDCEEYCNHRVYVDKKTKKEDGTTKRPPMCHIVPYNHIKHAVMALYADKLIHNYRGPDWENFDRGTLTKLVWHKGNLRPGHASCNSKTANWARGQPSNSDKNKAIAYVKLRLHKLEPNWI